MLKIEEIDENIELLMLEKFDTTTAAGIDSLEPRLLKFTVSQEPHYARFRRAFTCSPIV